MKNTILLVINILFLVFINATYATTITFETSITGQYVVEGSDWVWHDITPEKHDTINITFADYVDRSVNHRYSILTKYSAYFPITSFGHAGSTTNIPLGSNNIPIGPSMDPGLTLGQFVWAASSEYDRGLRASSVNFTQRLSDRSTDVWWQYFIDIEADIPFFNDGHLYTVDELLKDLYALMENGTEFSYIEQGSNAFGHPTPTYVDGVQYRGTAKIVNITSPYLPIPEPTTILFFGLGLLGMAGVTWKNTA